MHEGLNVLRILFYANLLGGERDTLEIIETERENDQKMEVELVNRRQRQNDDGTDDERIGVEEQEGQQPQQQQNNKVKIEQKQLLLPQHVIERQVSQCVHRLVSKMKLNLSMKILYKLNLILNQMNIVMVIYHLMILLMNLLMKKLK